MSDNDAETIIDLEEGIRIRIQYDVEGGFADPRKNDGNLGVMLCRHRDYTLGDEQVPSYGLDTEIECPKCHGRGTYRRKDCDKCEGAGRIEVSLAEYLRKERGARVILPLYLYDHGNITMGVGHKGDAPFDGAGWDTSDVGAIFDTTETRKECGQEKATDEEIERQLRAEVEEYALYISGQVYGYVIEDKDGKHLDSCWGFLGMDYIEQEARVAAQGHVDDAKAERAEIARRLDAYVGREVEA